MAAPGRAGMAVGSAELAVWEREGMAVERMAEELTALAPTGLGHTGPALMVPGPMAEANMELVGHSLEPA